MQDKRLIFFYPEKIQTTYGMLHTVLPRHKEQGSRLTENSEEQRKEFYQYNIILVEGNSTLGV